MFEPISEVVKILVVYTPGGIDRFFAEVGESAAARVVDDAADLAAGARPQPPTDDESSEGRRDGDDVAVHLWAEDGCRAQGCPGSCGSSRGVWSTMCVSGEPLFSAHSAAPSAAAITVMASTATTSRRRRSRRRHSVCIREYASGDASTWSANV